MFGQSFARATGLTGNARYFRSNVGLCDSKQTTNPTNVATPKIHTPDPETVLGPRMRRVTNFDRWMLVWMKKFPSRDQVPDKISVELFYRTQSQARVKTANRMIVLTLLGCLGAVILGKREAKAGRTLGNDNKEWHNKINAEFRADQAAASAEAARKASS